MQAKTQKNTCHRQSARVECVWPICADWGLTKRKKKSKKRQPLASDDRQIQTFNDQMPNRSRISFSNERFWACVWSPILLRCEQVIKTIYIRRRGDHSTKCRPIRFSFQLIKVEHRPVLPIKMRSSLRHKRKRYQFKTFTFETAAARTTRTIKGNTQKTNKWAEIQLMRSRQPSQAD